jgi:hypothetical protein
MGGLERAPQSPHAGSGGPGGGVEPLYTPRTAPLPTANTRTAIDSRLDSAGSPASQQARARLSSFTHRLNTRAPRFTRFPPQLSRLPPRLRKFAPRLSTFSSASRRFAPRLSLAWMTRSPVVRGPGAGRGGRAGQHGFLRFRWLRSCKASPRTGFGQGFAKRPVSRGTEGAPVAPPVPRAPRRLRRARTGERVQPFRPLSRTPSTMRRLATTNTTSRGTALRAAPAMIGP